MNDVYTVWNHAHERQTTHSTLSWQRWAPNMRQKELTRASLAWNVTLRMMPYVVSERFVQYSKAFIPEVRTFLNVAKP
jgi:hypothetical protein